MTDKTITDDPDTWRVETNRSGLHECKCGNGSALIPILDKRTFDFTNLKAGAANNDIEIVICPAIKVVDYNFVRLAVRVHALNMSISSAQTLRFLAYGALPSDDDPAQDFIDRTYSWLQVDITSSTPVPSLCTSYALYTDAYLRIVLYAAQSSSPMTFTAQLSASLVLRRT